MGASGADRVRQVSYWHPNVENNQAESVYVDFKKRFNEEWYVLASYNSVAMLAEAIKRAGGPDKPKIADEVAKTGYTGVTGQIAFDEKGDIKNGAISMFKVKEGKLEYISTSR